MPTKAEHVKKAEGNARFALSLSLDDQPKIDWALIALFYAALHYVEAYLSTIGQHVRKHGTRDSYVARDTNLRKIFKEYSDLKFYGYNARYEMTTFRAADVTGTANRHFQTIRSHLQPLL